MELWIRSQDKSMLLKVERLGISFNTRTDLDEYEIEVNDYPIGDYKTKERALEVLDEIQNILIDYKEMSRVVYQMPQD